MRQVGFHPQVYGNSFHGGLGGPSPMYAMRQMIMRIMQSLFGQVGGGHGGCQCCHRGMGQSLGFPGAGFPGGGFPGVGFPGAGFPGGGFPGAGLPGGGFGSVYPPLSGGHSAPAISSGVLGRATPGGRALANSIANSPVPPRCRPGYCYRGVKHHLRKIGVNLHGGSAHLAADQLARQRGKFKEVSVRRGQLRKLPPGAVVVWDRSPGKPHGHISIATGDGREASDKIRNQITNRRASYRVFLPK